MTKHELRFLVDIEETLSQFYIEYKELLNQPCGTSEFAEKTKCVLNALAKDALATAKILHEEIGDDE